jgi:general secretion pathway protein L
MLGKTVGLDIIEDTMTAVLVKGGLQGHQIMGCGATSISRSGSREAALVSLLEQVDASGAVCISSIPSDQISYRNLSLPFKDARKIDSIIVYELESLLPFAVDDLMVDFTITGQSAEQTDILAAAVKRSFLAEYLSFLQSHSVEPEVVDIRNVPTVMLLLKQADTPANGLFIDLGLEKTTLILFLHRRIVMIRKLHMVCKPQLIDESEAGDSVGNENSDNNGMASPCRHFSRTIRNTLMAFVDQTDETGYPEKVFITGVRASDPGVAEDLNRYIDLEVEQLDLSRGNRIELAEDLASQWNPDSMNAALALALRDSKRDSGFNFRKEEFEAKKQFLKFRKDIAKGAIVLAVLLALVMIDYGVDYYGMKKRYNALDRQIVKIFSQTLPGMTKIVDPVQQMRVQVDEMRKTAGMFAAGKKGRNVLDLLEDISKRVPSSLDVKVSRVVIDPEGMVIKGTTDTFNTVDSIKKGLDGSVFFSDVTISSANLDRSGNRVQFELRSELVL